MLALGEQLEAAVVDRDLGVGVGLERVARLDADLLVGRVARQLGDDDGRRVEGGAGVVEPGYALNIACKGPRS